MNNKTAKIILLLTGLFVIGVIFREICKNTASPQKFTLLTTEAKSLDSSSLNTIERIRTRFSVSIGYQFGNLPKFVENPHGKIRYEEASFSQVERYVLLLKSELLIYPDDIIKKAKIEKIILCRNLSMNGNKEAGVAGYDHGTIYVDVEDGSDSPEYQKLNIHHEIFHMVDYQDDFEIYSDNAWESLNQNGFVYTNQRNREKINKNILDRYQQSFFSEEKGFLLSHSMTGVEEDKAVMYSFVVSYKNYIDTRAVGDEIIESKRDYIKTLAIKFSPNFIQLLGK